MPLLALLISKVADLNWPFGGPRHSAPHPNAVGQEPHQSNLVQSAPPVNTSLPQDVADKLNKLHAAGKKTNAAVVAKLLEKLEKQKHDLDRLRSDTAALHTLSAALGKLAQMKALPPWVPSSISTADARSAIYDDHPPLGGNIRVATDYTYSRLDRILDSTTLRVFEVRHDQNGLPVNRTSVSNGAYRGSLTPPLENGGDPFRDRAVEIFQGMGYNMSDFVLCPKAGENYDARVGDKFIAIRSFMRKGRPRTSYPNLSLNLCSPDGSAGAAYVTGYFVFVNINLTSQ